MLIIRLVFECVTNYQKVHLLFFLIKRNVKWTLIITAGIVYFAAVYTGFYLLTKSPTEPDLATYITTELNNNLDTLAAGEKKMGFPEEQIQNDRKFYDLFYKFLVGFFILLSDRTMVLIHAVFFKAEMGLGIRF